MSHDATQPPPNNAGIHSTSIKADNLFGYTGRKVPRRKTLEFENLTITYDYDTGALTVVKAGGEEKMAFDLVELSELGTALTSFAATINSGTQVNYR